MSRDKYTFASLADARRAYGYPLSVKEAKAARKYINRAKRRANEDELSESEKRDMRWAVVIEAKAELGKYSPRLRDAQDSDEARDALQELCHLTTLSLKRRNPHFRCFHYLKRLKKYS